MDGNAPSVSPNDLYTHLGTAEAPLLIDVRRREAFDADKFLIIGAARRLPDDDLSDIVGLRKADQVVGDAAPGAGNGHRLAAERLGQP